MRVSPTACGRPDVLRTQPFSSLGPAAAENAATRLRRHAAAKAMSTFPNKVARLERALHFSSPVRGALSRARSTDWPINSDGVVILGAESVNQLQGISIIVTEPDPIRPFPL